MVTTLLSNSRFMCRKVSKKKTKELPFVVVLDFNSCSMKARQDASGLLLLPNPVRVFCVALVGQRKKSPKMKFEGRVAAGRFSLS